MWTWVEEPATTAYLISFELLTPGADPRGLRSPSYFGKGKDFFKLL